jgi:spore coat polysaccharide biosynthesis protein SpsF
VKTAIIIQARMTSTRLPGKVMKTVLGKTLLEYLLERLSRCNEADSIILATPWDILNQPIWDLAQTRNVQVFKGDENDVLGRYYGAAQEARAGIVVRVTSDCPLIDPAVVDQVIQHFKKHNSSIDYAANTLERTFPRGMDVEVFTAKSLESAFREATRPDEREHVTSFIYSHPERFRLANTAYKKDESRHRWTVDTTEDFELIRRILEALYPHKPEFTLEDILDLIAAHPGWATVNTHIEQKQVAR